MSYAADHPVHCARSDCTAWYPGSKWHAIKAADTGWFHSKDGNTYCPLHIPEWVSKWRARKTKDQTPD